MLEGSQLTFHTAKVLRNNLYALVNKFGSALGYEVLVDNDASLICFENGIEDVGSTSYILVGISQPHKSALLINLGSGKRSSKSHGSCFNGTTHNTNLLTVELLEVTLIRNESGNAKGSLHLLVKRNELIERHFAVRRHYVIDMNVVAAHHSLEGERMLRLGAIKLNRKRPDIVEGDVAEPLLVGIGYVEVQLPYHFLHDLMTLKDVELIFDTRSRHYAIELHESISAASTGAASTCTVILDEHHRRALVNTRLHSQIETSERQAENDRKDKPFPMGGKDVQNIAQ